MLSCWVPGKVGWLRGRSPTLVEIVEIVDETNRTACRPKKWDPSNPSSKRVTLHRLCQGGMVIDLPRLPTIMGAGERPAIKALT